MPSLIPDSRSVHGLSRSTTRLSVPGSAPAAVERCPPVPPGRHPWPTPPKGVGSAGLGRRTPSGPLHTPACPEGKPAAATAPTRLEPTGTRRIGRISQMAQSRRSWWVQPRAERAPGRIGRWWRAVSAACGTAWAAVTTPLRAAALSRWVVASGPPPGHPERLVPDQPPTPTERELWAQLAGIPVRVRDPHPWQG
ncbi:DUF6059 family protein [Kitasatospora sp. NPDC048540]|uniref:DUF6059 family protein n=1 Tax=Kitasatospora sp. NPDC048540 TaxID=3155634 RepID=UPI0033D883A8